MTYYTPMDKEKIKEDLKKRRYERKYVIEFLNQKEVEQIIKRLPPCFKEIHHVRKVNNFYFDTNDFHSFRDNLAGISDRIKFRARWYGETFGKISPVLELKIKKGELGWKVSFPLKEFVLNKSTSFKKIHSELFDKTRVPLEVLELLKHHSPVIMNTYTRKYFVSKDKKIRITLDYNQEFTKINHHLNNFSEKIHEHFIVLEIKYDEKDSDSIREMINYLPFRRTANSKYVNGIKKLYGFY